MSEKRHTQPRLLVVLPESQQARALIFYLEQQAYEVLWAHEGQSAYDILDADAVDALIYALREKRIDGLRVQQLAHKRNPAICAIAIAGPEDIELGVEAMRQENNGSSIDDLLKEEGILEEAQAQAVKEVVAWQLAEAMKTRKISKNKMAALLKTSRSQVDRLLDPKNDITLRSLQRAAAVVGRRVNIELVQESPRKA